MAERRQTDRPLAAVAAEAGIGRRLDWLLLDLEIWNGVDLRDRGCGLGLGGDHGVLRVRVRGGLLAFSRRSFDCVREKEGGCNN